MANFFDISIPKGITTNTVSLSNNVKQQENTFDVGIKANSDKTYSKIEHSNSQPLSEEQKAEKQKANQKQLDEMAKMKRAGKTISSTVSGAVGSTLTMLETYDKNGELKTVQTKRSDGSISYTANYDNGKQISGEGYFEDGTIASKSEFKDGNLIKETSYSSDGSGKVESSTSYEYFPNGKLKSEVREHTLFPSKKEYYENGNLKFEQDSSNINEYDETGKLLKKTFKSHIEEEPSSVTYYEYDKEGREVSSSKYSEDGKTLISKTETQYTGNKTCTIVYDASGKEKFRTEEEIMSDGSIIRREDNQFLSRTKVVHDEKLNSEETYDYTENGDLIAYSKPYINTEEEGVIDDKYYDAKGNEISYDEYVTILERSREK